MISRRTAMALGDLFEEKYHYFSSHDRKHTVYSTSFYDFLFERDYAAWFCNLIKKLSNGSRIVKEMIMKLHTGETLAAATPTWTWEQRQKLGQEYLFNLSQDILIYYEENGVTDEGEKKALKKLRGNLELDGYVFKDKKLLIPEQDVLEIREEIGVIQFLYTQLELQNKDITFHHLDLSEEHYMREKWDDSISNSRKFLESILREIVSQHYKNSKGTDLPTSVYESPQKIRDYLETNGLLENKEKDALAKIYGLLSNTGSHPYMAEKDQARLLRQLSLTVSQFVLLRYQGYKNSL